MPPLIGGQFDFGIVFEIISLLLLVRSASYLDKYNEEQARMYIILSMIPIGWLLICDVIFFLSNISNLVDFAFFSYAYMFEESLAIGYMLLLFGINKVTSAEIFDSIDDKFVNLELLEDFYEQCAKAEIEIYDDSNSDIYDYSDNNEYFDNFSLDPIDEYLQEIGKIPLLSAEEEQELGKLIKEGSPIQSKKAKDKLVSANLRLVVSIAKVYVTRLTATSYLNQLEQIGLLESEKIGREKIYKNLRLIKLLAT